ncbi:MAG TPA: hypothetical protein VFW94_10385, partial [Candidatus Acidoferrales bacterium]|nr:hypothetical protein [Candidatus Acidoferrales bacterium]
DSALATYADPGPDSGADRGLEQRILTRIAAERHGPTRRRWLAWAVGLPAAAILLLFAGLSIARRTYAPSPASQQGHISSQHLPRWNQQAAEKRGNDLYQGTTSVVPKKHSKEQRALASEAAPHSRRAARAAQAERLPKLDVFPTPQPLSPEEQALVIFAADANKSERESLVIAQQQANAPLHIAAIHIKPLQPPAAGAN